VRAVLLNVRHGICIRYKYVSYFPPLLSLASTTPSRLAIDSVFVFPPSLPRVLRHHALPKKHGRGTLRKVRGLFSCYIPCLTFTALLQSISRFSNSLSSISHGSQTVRIVVV
jgi:hypothetical protein